MRNRYKILHQVEQLEPEKDHQEIVYLVGSYEYPWLMRKSLEFALFRTYAVPSISRLLDQTRQFADHGQKRYDDTALIIAEITENGYDSERGRAAIRRMNQIHHCFDISNDDYLYVLSTFMFEPMRWGARYGWREPIYGERLAYYYFWREVGKRMNIRDIPDSLEAFEAFNLQYEAENFRYTDENYRVGEATVQIFLNWYPRFLRPIARTGIYAMMDDPMREAFGFPRAHAFIRWTTQRGLQFAGKLMRFFPPRRSPYKLTTEPNRTYPHGYEIEHLGPDTMNSA